jgi:peptidylprolyl isomerase
MTCLKFSHGDATICERGRFLTIRLVIAGVSRYANRHGRPKNERDHAMVMTALVRRLTMAAGFALAVVAMGAPAAVSAQTLDPQNTILLETKDGRVTIRLRPDLAPRHVEQIKTLTRRGFYDGVVFHRVIDGFMAQTGDPTGTGTGRSDLPNIPAEFSREAYKVGTVGMARAQDPNSANSQFFICFEGCGPLTGQYTIWGEVVSGMDAVRKIKRGDSARNGMVQGPDRIVRMRVLADAN